jgi:hypothetical protein
MWMGRLSVPPRESGALYGGDSALCGQSARCDEAVCGEPVRRRPDRLEVRDRGEDG